MGLGKKIKNKLGQSMDQKLKDGYKAIVNSYMTSLDFNEQCLITMKTYIGNNIMLNDGEEILCDEQLKIIENIRNKINKNLDLVE